MNQAFAPYSRTRSFTTIWLIEMWERFGYYGMAAVMVLFMVQHLGYSDTDANLTWGAFAALVYAAPALGGYIGDRYLGARRSMALGAAVLALGYYLLIRGTETEHFLFLSLGTIVVGNGLFKANAANLVRQIFKDDVAALDGAFTLYYMAVNVGSTVSMLATPWIQLRFGWSAAFAVCCAGLILGLIHYALMWRALAHIGSVPDQRPLNRWVFVAVLIGASALTYVVALILEHGQVARVVIFVSAAVVLMVFVGMITRAASSERAGLISALLLTLQSILFFVFYQQMGTSLTLFALRNVHQTFYLFGMPLFSMSAAQFQALNPIYIMAFSPLIAAGYSYLGRHGRNPSVAAKFVLGFVMVAVGFGVFGASARWAVHGMVSPWLLALGYLFYTLGEIFVSALGLAMIARYVPERMSGFMMGSYFIATGIAQYLGSLVANVAHVPQGITDPLLTLSLYTHLFNELGLVAAGGTLIAWALMYWIRRLDARGMMLVRA